VNFRGIYGLLTKKVRKSVIIKNDQQLLIAAKFKSVAASNASSRVGVAQDLSSP
jgi:hypothetical protein